MHVLRFADELPVQLDPRDGVEPVGHEIDPLLLEQFRVGAERRAIFPVRLADPLKRKLVAIEIRIGNFPGAEQIGVHAAGDFRGDDEIAQVRRHFGQIADGTDGPVAVKGFLDHNCRGGM